MRWKSLNRALLLFILVLGCGTVYAQLLSEHSRDTSRVYRSIERAMKDPDQVYVLHLKKKKLKEFPTEVLQFKNLNVLVLYNNKIKEVPDEIRELQYLQELNIGKNKLKSFPMGICELVHLKKLSLSENYIDAIPKEIADLKELIVLDLWSNDIYFYPDEMAELTELRFMDLRTIQINEEEQFRIQEMLPQAKVYFSTPCNCGF